MTDSDPAEVTEAELAELERLEKAATPASYWQANGSALFGPNDDGTGIAFDDPHDAAFIAAARHALPKLLATIRRLRAARREGTEQLLSLLANVRDVAATHHGDQPAHVLLHTLTVEIPEMIDKALAHPDRREGEAGLAKELHDVVMKIRPKDFADTSDYTCGHFDGVRAAAAVLLTYPRLAALAHPPEPDRATESERKERS